ncbi:MerR family transcriptional regulator [bacterium]|nr:MerR family transcriptional regulator [bacterium]
MSQVQPEKLYYSISEVAKLTGVKAHVLRYWESEFPTLHPRKTRTGSRRYRQPDIDEILAIKKLLYDEGFKIAGAKKMRRQAHSTTGTAAPPQMTLSFTELDSTQQLAAVKEGLTEILALVRSLKAATRGAAEKEGKA